MYSREITIHNASGLHARPASEFVREAGKYKSSVTIRRKDTGAVANAKSIILLLSLSLSKGTQAVISAEGEDEQCAVDNLAALIESGFGE